MPMVPRLVCHGRWLVSEVEGYVFRELYKDWGLEALVEQGILIERGEKKGRIYEFGG